MADEEVMGSVSPTPSDHKRKLDDLDSEPIEQPPPSAADSNGNSQSVDDGDAVNTTTEEGHDAKRPRFDDKSDGSVEAGENGHSDEREQEPKEYITESSPAVKNIEPEDDQEKHNEPLDTLNKESATDKPDAKSLELQSATNESDIKSLELHADNPEESAKEEHHESGVEQPTSVDDPTPTDVASHNDVSGLNEHSVSTDQLSSRKMEVPSNKVGVLIGKAGDTIRTLQYSSGARIQITRDVDADPSSATRPVELIGSIENINKAERLIKEVIAEADAGGSPSLVARGLSVNSSGIGEQVHIQVPNDKVGVIIGKGGETIKNLQTRSGARIQLIPQHLPEGDQSKERTVRVTGDRNQIETAKELIKEVMEQPIRSATSSGGNNQQSFRPRGSGPQWGPRGGYSSQPTGYNNYPPRGGSYPSQNPPYSSQGYGNYPPHQPPPKNNYGWDQRPPTNMQGPPEQPGYDYYGGQGAHMSAPSGPPPIRSHAPGPPMGPPPSQVNYNYGQPQGPDYGQPAPYSQNASQGYGQGYGEPRYDHQGPGQHPYGNQGTQPSAYPHGANTNPGYGQHDQYGKTAYSVPPQGPYGQPQQQPYPASSGPMQPAYPQYGTAPAPTANDGYSHSMGPTAGYGQPGGQPLPGYGHTGGQQPTPGYAQPGPTAGYGQYPSAQPGYSEQPAPASAGYGYQRPPDPAYGGGPGMAYGAQPPVQPAYSQPAPVPASVPPQSGYDQSVPQAGGFVTQPQPQPQPQAGYGQYDSSQMYAAPR